MMRIQEYYPLKGAGTIPDEGCEMDGIIVIWGEWNGRTTQPYQSVYLWISYTEITDVLYLFYPMVLNRKPVFLITLQLIFRKRSLG